jgi:hypothetical protein
MQHHKYSLNDLENMMPWEREIYIIMIRDYIDEENKRLAQQNKG